MKDSNQVIAILRESLDRDQSVEIEGLGTFRKSPDGGYGFIPERQPQVFIAYVHEDLPRARRLCESLRAAGCSPWLDKDQLLPGQNWPRSIERAIENSDSFVACFSPRSIVKRGQFQSELRYALDCARSLPLESVFVIPVRFERCEIPRRISDQVQYVDLFPDWDRGVNRALRAIRRTSRNRPIARLDHA
jgi:hypothetical protein